jgi:ADP-heptose:LPS heptosyltransferase
MNLLVLRFSAMGDLVIALPYLLSLLETHSHVSIFLGTKEQWSRVVPKHPRLVLLPFTARHANRGLRGLLEYAHGLRSHSIDVVADLHNNLRSHLICSYLGLFKVPCFRLSKRRAAKRALLGHAGSALALPYVGEQYRAVLSSAILSPLAPPQKLDLTLYYPLDPPAETKLAEELHWVGFAPFAAHGWKALPLDKCAQFLNLLMDEENIGVVLMGHGKEENAVLSSWQQIHPQRILLSRSFKTFAEEIHGISSLRLMVCMDSANLHLAHLAGCPTLSIWGPTHPDLGFAPPGDQHEHFSMSEQALPCRPCSVFGQTPCSRGDHLCMQGLDVFALASRVKELVFQRG